jgi:hypothetical protein
MLVGKMLGPYKVDKELGSGAMGSVYRAIHQETGERVAVKMISIGLSSNKGALDRFKREVTILKQFDHRNIAKFITSGRVANTPFFIMEFLEGESLDHVIARRGRISWEELVPIGTQLCAALEHAHLKGIIHRDLKPSNLMILKDGTVKLTDFGIAKDDDATALTAANSTLGTAAYMSPEQCHGKDLTPKSDLYSMGIMFYELITGRKPFVADSAMEMFKLHTKGTFPRPSKLVLELPIWLDTLICQLMEKKPEQRPLNAAKVAEALLEIQERVSSQVSAGLTVAKRRKADKTGNELAIDDEDKEIARTMMGKKTKKKKATPFYAKNWFTFSAVGVMLLLLGVFVWWAFIKAPSPEAMVARLESMATTDEGKREARDTVIPEFLKAYPAHPLAAKVNEWRDRIDLETTERQTTNRRKAGRFQPDDGSEKLAWTALDDEEAGKLDDANKRWQELLPTKKSDDRDQRGYGLLAEKYLKEYRSVDDLSKDLRRKLAEEQALGKKAKGDTEAEQIALDATRGEMEEKYEKAKVHWDDLKKHADGQPDLRRWWLLASKRVRELATK